MPPQFTIFKAINQTMKVLFHDPILICSLLALGKVLKEASACAGIFPWGIIFAQIFIQTVVCALILARAVSLTVLYPIITHGLMVSFMLWFMKSSVLFLHIMVALEEVSDFTLAEFGVTELTGGGSTAQNEICTFLRAIGGTLVWEDQLLQSILSIIHKVYYVEAVSSPCIFRII